jgi:hypothetical protein
MDLELMVASPRPAVGEAVVEHRGETEVDGMGASVRQRYRSAGGAHLAIPAAGERGGERRAHRELFPDRSPVPDLDQLAPRGDTIDQATARLDGRAARSRKPSRSPFG